MTLFLSQQGSSRAAGNQLSHPATVGRTTVNAFKTEKGVTFFFVEGTFPSERVKHRLFVDNTTPHLPGDICFATSLQPVGIGRDPLPQPADTHWLAFPHSAHNGNLWCSFSIPVLFRTSSASEITSPPQNSALLHFLYVLPFHHFQHFCYAGCSVGSPGVKIHPQPSHLLSFHPRLFLLRGLTSSSFLF